jgi:phosphatidylglycerophosphate synthase
MKILKSILLVLWLLLLGFIWAIVLNVVAFFVLIVTIHEKVLKYLRNKKEKTA